MSGETWVLSPMSSAVLAAAGDAARLGVLWSAGAFLAGEGVHEGIGFGRCGAARAVQPAPSGDEKCKEGEARGKCTEGYRRRTTEAQT